MLFYLWVCGGPARVCCARAFLLFLGSAVAMLYFTNWCVYTVCVQVELSWSNKEVVSNYIGDPDVPDVPDVFNVFDVLVSNMENAAAAVAVKAPPFISSNPAMWFVILGAQFNIAGIVASSTKFYHALANLPVETVSNLDDAILQASDYDQLKESVKRYHEKRRGETLRNFPPRDTPHRQAITPPATDGKGS